jgi:hypothetical protein
MESTTHDRTTNPTSSPSATAPTAASDGDPASAVRGVAGEAREAVGEVTRQARSAGRRQLARARHRGQQLLADQGLRQKDRARQELDTLAGALRAAAGVLEEEEQRLLGRSAVAAARRVESVAAYLEGHELRELAADARRLARGNPEVFLGGLFVGGVALGRFLRSSAPAEPATEA